MNYLVFDIGGSSIKYGLLDENATIMMKNKFSVPENFDALIDEMYGVFKQISVVDGIAISAPGSVDPIEGVIHGISAIDYIHGPNFIEIFKERFAHNIVIENDANCAGLAEAYFGNGTKYSNISYVVLGSGIGGANIIDNKIHYGSNLHGSEYGYQIINENLETWSESGSTINLVNKVNKSLNVNNLTGEEVFELAKTNTKVKKLVDEFYRVNAIGLYNIQYSFDPDIILIGGGVSDNEEFIKRITNEVKSIYEKKSGKICPKIKKGQFGSDANLIGALANLLKGQDEKKI